jgi:hypothetical protein
MCTIHSPSLNGGAATHASSLASPSIDAATCRFSMPVLFVLFLFSILYDAAAFSEASNSQSPMHTRPCSLNSGLPRDSKAANGSPQSKSPEAPARPPACLEVKGDPIELQEFLQALIRDQKWRIDQAQGSAESWSFVRYLDPGELSRFAQTEILGKHIVWTEGKAAVRVTTTEAGDGFTRVEIAAKFLGKGNSNGRFARPMDFWPLVSRGSLEGSMVAALENRSVSNNR